MATPPGIIIAAASPGTAPAPPKETETPTDSSPAPATNSHVLKKTKFDQLKSDFDEWKKGDDEPMLLTDTQKELWKESKDYASAFFEEHKDDPSSDPLVEAIEEETEKLFKGALKSEIKKTLKREREAFLFGTIHSHKKMKYMHEFHKKSIEISNLRYEITAEELQAAKEEINKLKAENQSLVSAHYKNNDKMEKKDDDLKIVAMTQCAKKYAEKQKVGALLFRNHGFVISKSLLSGKPRSIQNANDFGPNSAKAGRPFFAGLFRELSKGPAVHRMEEICEIPNHEMVYNSAIDKKVADDKSTPYTGHPLDTPQNRRLVWYGDSARGINGVAVQLVKAFNGKRSDDSSKKIRPAIAATLFNGIRSSASARTKEQSDTLAAVVKAIKNPRGKNEAKTLKPMYEILCLQMNPDLKADRVKLFVATDGTQCYGTNPDRNNPIVRLSYKGKARLHTCNVADCLTTAEEAWIILHVARCYYFHFEETLKTDDCPVTPQGLTPGKGTAQSYTQKDVDYYRFLYKEISKARKEEKEAELKGTLNKHDSYCYFFYPDEAKTVANETAAVPAPQPEKASPKSGGNAENPCEVDDDSVGDDDVVESF